jgi:parallel beta-helix repeat protein
MKLNGLFLFIIVITFSLVLIGGCIVNENKDQKKEEPNIHFYVSKDFNNMTEQWNITHFSSINSAIEKSSNNLSIYVYQGTYFESIVIDKKIILQGEDPFQTIIDAKQVSEDVILVEGNGILNISGFTIRNSSHNSSSSFNAAGIDLRSDGNIITNNIISENFYGIYCPSSNNNTIMRNHFKNNIEYGGFFLLGSDYNLLKDNVFSENIYCALRIKGSQFNIVTQNVFMNNPKGLYLCCGTENTIVSNNIFCNQSDWDAYDYLENNWDDGNRGNFWDQYHLEEQGAFDNDSNGIVDTPYAFPYGSNIDHYPLKYKPVISNSFIDEKILNSNC